MSMLFHLGTEKETTSGFFWALVAPWVYNLSINQGGHAFFAKISRIQDGPKEKSPLGREKP